jgi:hypothetical protein
MVDSTKETGEAYTRTVSLYHRVSWCAGRTVQSSVSVAQAICRRKRGPLLAERMQQAAYVYRLTVRMHTDDATAQAWIDALLETLCETFKAGKA